MSNQLEAAYHKLYDLWWNHTATVDIDIPGYNGISYDETIVLDEAAETIEQLLLTEHEPSLQEPLVTRMDYIS